MSGEDKHSIIRLKPKVSPDKILAGFPWVYDNELVLDRRTKQLTSGKIVELQDSARNFLATAVVNPKSKIFARVITKTANKIGGSELVFKRISAAKALREGIFTEPYYRLINSAADQMPDSYWIQTILKGKGSMPAVRITEEQAQIVIDYIRDSN